MGEPGFKPRQSGSRVHAHSHCDTSPLCLKQNRRENYTNVVMTVQLVSGVVSVPGCSVTVAGSRVWAHGLLWSMPCRWRVAVTDSPWLFLYLRTKNVCKTNNFKRVYVSQDSACPVSCDVLWVQKCLFIFTSHCSLLELNSKLWKYCSSRTDQVPDIVCNVNITNLL